jgi:hypothetical protein
MTRRELFQLGSNRVTVSTVAPTPEAFMEFCESKCVLAWSVHAVSCCCVSSISEYGLNAIPYTVGSSVP